MAKKIEWQQPAIDAAIVVGGGAILQTQVVSRVAQLQSLLGNLPDVMGISLQTVVLGAVALIAVKALMK